MLLVAEVKSRMSAHDGIPPPQGDGRATQGNSLKETQWRVGPELRLLILHFFNICRHHRTLKFKPHATDDERYVSGIDGVPLSPLTFFSAGSLWHAVG